MTLLRNCLLGGLLGLLAQDPEKISFAVLAGYDYTEGMTLPKEVTDLFAREQEPGRRGERERQNTSNQGVLVFEVTSRPCQ